MKEMFYECKSLKNLDLSNFNTKNVTDMSDMFSYCESITDINLSNFNVQNVKNKSYITMFSLCNSLKNIIKNF